MTDDVARPCRVIIRTRKKEGDSIVEVGSRRATPPTSIKIHTLKALAG